METPKTVTLTHAKAHLEDLLTGVVRGEEWLITDAAGQPLAKLTALSAEDGGAAPGSGTDSLIGLMAGQIKFLPGWDDPLEEFEPYS